MRIGFGCLGLALFLLLTLPAGASGYIANPTAGTVTALDLTTVSSTATAAVTSSTSAKGILLVRPLSLVYATEPAANAVAVLNATTLARVATIAVGSNPHSLAQSPNAAYVYATNNTAGTVSVIDTATNRVVATVTVGRGPRGLTVSGDGQRVYVANFGDDSLSVIATATNTVSATLAVGAAGPVDVLIDDGGTFVYAVSATGRALSVISPTFGTALRTIDLGAAANGIATAPKSGAVFVPTQAGTVRRVSTSTLSVTASLSGLTNAAAVAFSADAQTGYAIDDIAGSLTRFTPATMTATTASAIPAGARAIATPDVIAETGLWYNAAQSGRGYSLEQQGQNIFVAYYVYRNDGSAVWYITTCALSGSTCSGTMTEYRGGIALSSLTNAAAAIGSVGSAQLSFATPTTATLTWPGGDVALQRYPFNATSTPAAGTAGTPQSGWWYDPSYGGAGFFVESQRTTAGANRMFLAGYMYAASGAAVWYVAEGTMTSTSLFEGSLSEFAGGSGIAATGWTPPTASATRATFSLRFTSTSRATLTLSTGVTLALQRFAF